jgi:hypothetical protein
MKEPAVQTKTPETVLPKASATSSPVLSTRSAVYPIFQLQRAIGNQSVQRFIQAKLTISQPSDQYKHEADQVLDRVMRMPGPQLQRKCACGNHASGECAECSKKKRLGLQTKLKVSEVGDIYEQEADRVANQVMATPAHHGVSDGPARIQRFAGQPTGQVDVAPASVDQALAASGRALEPALQHDMEQRFGYDFSRVRVHTDTSAAESARAVSARAYTVGGDIVFGRGHYAPGTSAGKRLLAHELTHVVQQSGKTGVVNRHPAPPPSGGGGAAPQARVVYIDANVVDQINRGNEGAANGLRQMRASGVDVRIAPFQYNELVTRPDIPRTATANRLLLQDTNIGQGAAPTMAQRVDINLAGQTAAGQSILSPGDQQLIASARAANAEVWSFDRAIRNDPQNIQNTFGIRVAPESQLPLAQGRADYRVGRQLLGLEPVQISLMGEVTRGAPPSGGGATPTGGALAAGAPPVGITSGASASPGARVVAGGVGIIIVLNEILGGINRARSAQQSAIDIGEARLAFWERFGATPTRGVWDVWEKKPLPPETTPTTSLFHSWSIPYVVDINVENLRRNLPNRIDSYQDFLYFLDAARTLDTIEEDPPAPSYPNREQRAQSRRYFAWVNQQDRTNSRVYDITDLIIQVRDAALGELDAAMREQTRALTAEQKANIYRLKAGPETPIYRSAGGKQPIITAQQVFGPDPWVRTTGQRKDVGGWFSTDMRALVVPANADAQRAALVSGYWVHQPIEDTFDEVREGGRSILDRQPAEGPITSFVAGPEPGSASRFGETRYYRHPDPDMRWTIALGELHEFWVKVSDLESVATADVESSTAPR